MRRAFAVLFVLVLLAGCGKASPSAKPLVPGSGANNSPFARATPSPAPSAASAEATPEASEALSYDHRPDYADTLDVDALTALDILGRYETAAATRPQDAGWMMLGHSTKSIEGTIVSADDYMGQWRLAFQGDQDRVASMVNFTISDLYTCAAEYPDISEVCANELGTHWIEYNGTRWRLMQLKSGGMEPAAIEEGAIQGGALPRITSPEYHALVLYESSTGRLRTLDGSSGAWHDAEGSVHTPQLTPPEAVNDYICWVEETSRGWAAVTLQISTGKQGGYLLEGIKRPVKTTFDGQMLFVQSSSGALYCYDEASDRIAFACSGVTSYQHIPGDGAVVAVDAAAEQQLVRFQWGPGGENYILPLMAVKDGGRVIRTFHHSYELDVELFLIERDGSFEQTTISMRRSEP